MATGFCLTSSKESSSTSTPTASWHQYKIFSNLGGEPALCHTMWPSLCLAKITLVSRQCHLGRKVSAKDTPLHFFPAHPCTGRITQSSIPDFSHHPTSLSLSLSHTMTWEGSGHSPWPSHVLWLFLIFHFLLHWLYLFICYLLVQIQNWIDNSEDWHVLVPRAGIK